MSETLYQHSKKMLVVGVILHVDPKYLTDFYALLDDYPHCNIIFSEESKGKMWIMKGEDRRHDR